MCTGPHTFHHLYRLDSLGRCRRDQAALHRLGMSRSLTLISQMIAIFAETRDILLVAFGVLNEESKSLGLRVSSVKFKIQAFNDVLDAAVLSVPVCGKDVKVVERFTLPWQ